MKILFINSVYNMRSTGRLVKQISDCVVEHGGQRIIAYGRGNKINAEQVFKVESRLGVLFHAARSRITNRQAFYSKGAVKRLLQIIDKTRPDLINLHNLHGYYLHVTALLGAIAERDIPIVWTFHDCWPYTGHCAYYEYVACMKWASVNGCSDCPNIREYPRSYVLDNSAKNFKEKKNCFADLKNLCIVTPSKWLSDQVQSSFFGNTSVKVINNGIDTQVFHPVRLREAVKESDNRKIILGVASPWSPRKGLKDFIALSKYLDMSKFKILLVGVNNRQKLMLPNDVTGIRQTHSVKELAELYRQAHVYLNLTYEDNYPTTNLEARACGLPVITYDSGGSPESAGHKNVVPKGDIKAVADLINKDLIQREFVNTNTLDVKSMQLTYLHLFQEILNMR